MSGATLPAPAGAKETLTPGRRLGRYRLVRALGRGAAGAVFRAVDEESGTEVALKVLAPDPAERDAWGWRLRREFYQMAQLEHPHIVRVLDWGEEGELHFYAMELLVGHDAARLAPLAAEAVVEVLAAVASALALLHARGFLHQDVKPQNILIPDGDDGQPEPRRTRLIDFGLLRLIKGAVEERAGTRGFIAPEILLGAPPDERADLYSLGATGFALLSGRPPPQPLGLAESAPPLPDVPVPRALGELIAELMAADPRQRPPSMAEVLGRLGRMGAGLDLSDASRAAAYLTRPPLVARAAALEQLRAAWGQAASGHGQVVFVVGTPGLGRSRLLADFGLELRVAGAEVGEARGGPGMPGATLVELLWPWLRDPSLTGGTAAPATQALETLAMGRSNMRRAEVPALAQAAVKLVEVASRRRPVALLVDDVQRCDPISLAAFEQLARNDQGARLLVLAVGAEPGEREALVRRLRRGRGRVVVLEPLGDQDLQELLGRIFGDARLSDVLVEALTVRSGGRPAHVLSLCRGLLERGSLVFSAGRWQLPRRLVPGELTGAGDGLAAALQRAPRTDDEHLLVDLLEVAGGRLDTASLAEASSLPPRQLVEALESLRLRGTVVVHRGATSAPATHEQVALDAGVPRPLLKDGRRLQLAVRLSGVIERRLHQVRLSDQERLTLEMILGGLLVQRGGAFALSGAGWLARAGTRSYLRGTFADAVPSLTLATQVLAEDGGPERHPELLDLWEQLGLCHIPGDTTLALECFRRIEAFLDRRGELSRISRAEERLGPRLGTVQGLLAVALDRALGRRAGSILELPDELARYARTLGYLSATRCMLGFMEAGKKDIDRLELLARARGGTAVAAGLFARANWCFGCGHLQPAKTLAKKTLAVLAEGGSGLPAEQHELVTMWSHFVSFWSDALLANADLDLAALQAVRTDDELAAMHALLVPVVYHAERGCVTRMLAARETLFQQCFRLRPTYQEAYIYAPSARALFEAGLFTQLREDVATLASLEFPHCPAREIIYRLVPAVLHLADSEPRQALALFDAAAAIARAPATASLVYLAHSLDLSADACILLGRTEEAAARARDAVAVSRDPLLRLHSLEARGLRTLARLALLGGQLDQAEEQLTAASRVNTLLCSPGEAAQEDLLAAEIQLAGRHLDLAVASAKRAEARLAELGNAAGARRAQILRQLATGSGRISLPPDTDPSAPTELDADTTIDAPASSPRTQRGRGPL
jgi:hypothetical protein